MLQIFQFLVLCLVGVAFSNPIFSPFNPGYILTRFGLRSQNSIFYPVTSLERSEDPFATVDEEPDEDSNIPQVGKVGAIEPVKEFVPFSVPQTPVIHARSYRHPGPTVYGESQKS